MIFVTSQPVEFTEENQENKEDYAEGDNKEAVKEAKNTSDKDKKENNKDVNLSADSSIADQINYAMDLYINKR